MGQGAWFRRLFVLRPLLVALLKPGLLTTLDQLLRLLDLRGSHL
jgi:hypothetical protein